MRLELKPDGVFVYRVYDWTDKLLYVGITNDLCTRMASHRQTSLWWNAAKHVEWEVMETRNLALREEKRLIGELQPSCNIIGVGV